MCSALPLLRDERPPLSSALLNDDASDHDEDADEDEDDSRREDAGALKSRLIDAECEPPTAPPLMKLATVADAFSGSRRAAEWWLRNVVTAGAQGGRMKWHDWHTENRYWKHLPIFFMTISILVIV